MNLMQVYLIAVREFLTRARSKGFLFVSGLMFVGAVVAPVVSLYLPAFSESAQKVTIALHDPPEGLEEMIEYVNADVFELKFITTEITGDELDEALLERTTSAHVVIENASDEEPTLVWRRSVDDALESLINVSYTRLAIIERAETENLGSEVLAELLKPVEHTNRIADPQAQNRIERVKEDMRRTVATIGLITAFMIPQFFGQFTMMSVIEEKASRVIEVVLSQVKTTTLLLGKVIGLSVLGLVQISLILAAFIGSVVAVRSVVIPQSVWRFFPFFAICLILGLLMYITLFALIGSLISNQEDASQVMMPALVPLVAGFGVGQAAIAGDASHPVMQVFTWLPLTSPMLLPVRIARDAITPLELWGALGVQLLAIVAVVWLAARVFEFTLLRIGTRVTWSELFKSLRNPQER